MGLETPTTQKHQVQILTTRFQLNGGLEAVGDLINFVNDPRRDSFSIHDTQMGPLMPGSPLGSATRSQVVIRRSDIVLLYFVAAEVRATIRKLSHSLTLVAYTPVAVCRGQFHMSAESKFHDFLESTASHLLVVSGARIFPLVELPSPFTAEADVLMVGHAQVLAYHAG